MSNDILPTNADGAMGFRQNSDLFYLCGVDQEDTILMIFPGVKDGKHKEVLFIKENSRLYYFNLKVIGKSLLCAHYFTSDKIFL